MSLIWSEPEPEPTPEPICPPDCWTCGLNVPERRRAHKDDVPPVKA